MKRKKGFTLIELMIVLAVIAMLSTVVVPKVGAIKVQSKNYNVSSNVLLVRSYLENRNGRDAIAYQAAIAANPSVDAALNSVLTTLGTDMVSNFSGSNAITNPFSNISSIVYSQGNITSKSPVTASALLAYYCVDTTLPDNSTVGSSTDFPKGIGYAGNVIVVLYSTGYVLYGVDNSGQQVNINIIKFPVTAPSAMTLPSGGTGGTGSGIGGIGSTGSSTGTGGNTITSKTIADYLAANCLSVYGDGSTIMQLGNGSTSMNIDGSIYLQGQQSILSEDITVTGDLSILDNGAIDMGNNGSNVMNVNGSVNIQGQTIIFKENKAIIDGNLSVLSTGSTNSINIGNGSGASVTVNGATSIQGDKIILNSNLTTNGNVNFCADSSVNFSNSGINTIFNNGNVQIQSLGSIDYSNNFKIVNSRFSTVANQDTTFKNAAKVLALDTTSSAYIQSGGNIIFDYIADINSPVTMISGGNLTFTNAGVSTKLNGIIYLKAGSNVNMNRSLTLGSAYIEADTFNYVAENIVNSLSTHITTFYGGSLSKNATPVTAQQPSAPAIAPTLITPTTPVTQASQIKTFKSNISYTSAYDTNTYADLAFRAIKGSDANAVKQALIPTGENIGSDVYKFLIIDGDCTLDWHEGNNIFSNYIIYCTGTMNIASIDLKFTNSAIIAKNVNIKPSTYFNMTQLSSSKYSQNVKNEINTICSTYLQ